MLHFAHTYQPISQPSSLYFNMETPSTSKIKYDVHLDKVPRKRRPRSKPVLLNVIRNAGGGKNAFGELKSVCFDLLPLIASDTTTYLISTNFGVVISEKFITCLKIWTLDCSESIIMAACWELRMPQIHPRFVFFIPCDNNIFRSASTELLPMSRSTHSRWLRDRIES